MPTSKPFRASATAVARPMPLLPPVTMATRVCGSDATVNSSPSGVLFTLPAAPVRAASVAGVRFIRVLREMRREPSAILLAVQLAGVLVYPFAEDTHAGRAVFSLLGVVILVLVVLAVRRTPALTWLSILLGIPAVVLLLIQAVSGSDELLPYSSAFEAVLYFYAAGAMIAYMLGDHEITRDELFAIGATFTLLAWAFAYTYIVCQAIEPGSFSAANATGARSWMELLFLSFTTLTSVGLSDVTPVKPFARGLAMLEMAGGLAYVAMLVSRIVSLSVFRREA